MFSFPSTKGLIWGISAQSTSYRGPVPLLLWVCNVTDEPQPVATCADIDRFWVQGIEVFDSLGHRVPTIVEETEKRLRSSGKSVRCLRVNSCAKGILQSIFQRTQVCMADFPNWNMILRETFGSTTRLRLADTLLFHPKGERIASQSERRSVTKGMRFRSLSEKGEHLHPLR